MPGTRGRFPFLSSNQRLLVHGQYRFTADGFAVRLLAWPDPYQTTDMVELALGAPTALVLRPDGVTVQAGHMDGARPGVVARVLRTEGAPAHQYQPGEVAGGGGTARARTVALVA